MHGEASGCTGPVKGMRRGKRRHARQDPAELLWIRNAFIGNPGPFAKTVVFGYTVLSEPLLRENRIGIDTGVVYCGPLTCVELPARRIHRR